MPTFQILNATDHVWATPDTYPSFRAALEGLEAVGARFQALVSTQGYYRTSRGELIDPAFVDLEIWDSKGYFAGSMPHYSRNGCSPWERLLALLDDERPLGARFTKGRLLFRQGAGLPKGYAFSAAYADGGSPRLVFSLFVPGCKEPERFASVPFVELEDTPWAAAFTEYVRLVELQLPEIVRVARLKAGV